MEKKKDPGKRPPPPTVQQLQETLDKLRQTYAHTIAENNFLRKRGIYLYRQLEEIESRNLLLVGIYP